MREPVFTEAMQVALVVRDLEATMRTYVHEYGIGPWAVYEFNPETVTEMVKDGEPAEYAFRLALAVVGRTRFELIQPLDGKSMYAEFLAEQGEGLHHIALGASRTTATRSTPCARKGAACSKAASTRASASPTCRPTRISGSSRRSRHPTGPRAGAGRGLPVTATPIGGGHR